MFTGIIEAVGPLDDVVTTDRGRRLTIDLGDLSDALSIGDSVAVDGTCLTVVEVDDTRADFEVVAETLSRTTLGALEKGDNVNLERSTRVGDRLDGHIVSGHIDGVGTVIDVTEEGDGSRRVVVEVPSDLRRYLIEKGSVCVDGASLTVAIVTDSGFEVALIPHTLEVTGLGKKSVGDNVNLEMDVVAKYVERLVGAR